MLIGGLGADTVDCTGRPAHHNRIDEAGRAQTEVQTGVTSGLKTSIGPYLGDLIKTAGFDLDAGPKSVPIGVHTDSLDAQPVALPSALVAQ